MMTPFLLFHHTRDTTRPSDRVLLIAGALLSTLAGIALIQGSTDGLEWEVTGAIIGTIVMAVALVDHRVALTLFALSFATVFLMDLRLKVGGLLIPPPALIAAILCARELVLRLTGSTAPGSPIPVLALLVLFGSLMTSGLAAVDVQHYVAAVVKWMTHVVVFISLVKALRRREWADNLADLLNVVVGAFAVYGLYRVFTGQSSYIDIFDTVATRAGASFYFTALLPIAYVRLISGGRHAYIPRFMLFAVLITAQVFTYNRAGWIASTCGLVFVTGRRVRLYLLLVLGGIVLIAVVPQEVRDRFMSLFIVADYNVNSPYASSTIERQHLLITGLHVVKDHWLVGVGLGNYLDRYYAYAIPGSTVVPRVPHNFYVYLWAESGVGALASFLWFYGWCCLVVWKARQTAPGRDRVALVGFAGCFVAMAIQGLAEDHLNLILTWTLLGIGVAFAYVPKVRVK